MKLFGTLSFVLWAASLTQGEISQGISDSIYARFTQMASICMATYAGDLCPSPGGLEKVADITNTTTDIHGWILLDNSAQEIMAVFRGTESLQNYETDTNYTLASFDILPECAGCQVHGGYYLAWVSVVDQVRSLLEQQASEHPEYSIVITGHSLGGSMAALAAAQYSSAFPNITLYTLGEPRTGNPAFADFMEREYEATDPSTTRYFRITHADDGVPNEPPESDGYVHPGLEFWSEDPISPQNTFICMGREIQCCEAQGGSGINGAHLVYFGKPVLVGGQCL